jgi:hypothetical protein
MHLLGFLHGLIGAWNLCSSRSRPSFKSMMTESCSLLIYEAIARAPVTFSPAFLARVEEHAPVSLAFLADLRERVQQEAKAP